MVTVISYFVTVGPILNPLKILDFNKSIMLTLIISTNITMEGFIFFSAFLGTYKVIRIYDSKGRLSFYDLRKLFISKVLRLLPLLYLVFFFGWIVGPWLNSGPFWLSYRDFFD